MSGDLEHSPADIIRKLLVDLGHATNPEDNGAWPAFVNYSRDMADNSMVVHDTDPITHGRHQIDGETQLHYGIQVSIRAEDDPTCFRKANDITEAFDKDVLRDTVSVGDTTGTGTSTYAVQAIHHSGVINVGREAEATARRVKTINAFVSLRMTS